MMFKKIYSFSDKAAMYLYRLVSKHNIRFWRETNSRVSVETFMKSPELNA